MKKLLLLAAFGLLLTPATQSFAGETAAELGDAHLSILGFRPSNNVNVLYGDTNHALGGGGPQGYVVMSKHGGGDRVYGTTTNSNLISTPSDGDCKGLDVLECLAVNGATVLNAANDAGGGQAEISNVASINGWEIE